MFSFFKDFKWQYLKIDITRLLGRTYYFWGVAFWATVDTIVFIALGIQLTTLIVAIPLGIATAVAVIKWLGTLMYGTLSNTSIAKLIEDLSRGIAFQGEQGCGKSSTINQLGHILSKKHWKELQREYWLIMNEPYETLPEEIKERYDEIINAYRYYIKHIDTHIPCLHSFYPLKDKYGRKSHPLSKEHLLQKKRLPYRSVWVCDEVSSMLPNESIGSVKNEKYLREIIRWIRHFTDSYGLFADIRFGDAFLAVRSGCGTVITLTKKQKWLLKPKFLCFIKEFYYSLLDFDLWLYTMFNRGSCPFYTFERRLRLSSKRTGPFMKWLNTLINNTGYRKYTYKKQGCRDNGLNDNGGKQSGGNYYFKSCLDVKYNDRVFKNLYRAKDLPFEEPNNSLSWFPSSEELRNITGIK